jgi:hypothetical protein
MCACQIRVPESLPAAELRSSMDLQLRTVWRSGARIIVSITRTVDQPLLHELAAVYNLHDASRYAWLGISASFTSISAPSFTTNGSRRRGYIYTRARSQSTSSQVTEAYRARFRAATTRYDLAVHGPYNASSGAPFYDDAHEHVLWDTDYATTGDGKPRPHSSCTTATPAPRPTPTRLLRPCALVS